MFSPSKILFSEVGVMRSKTVAYVHSSMSGVYSLNVKLSGSSSSLYEVVYPQGRVVTILGEEDQPAPSRCVSAIFSDTGGFITLSFDVSTNMGQLPTVFKCSRVVSFRDVKVLDPRCVWRSNRVLELYSSGDGGLGVGETVTVVGDAVKAECVSIVGPTCAKWAFSPSQTLILKPSLNPVRPTVQISGPRVIGSCSSLLLD